MTSTTLLKKEEAPDNGWREADTPPSILSDNKYSDLVFTSRQLVELEEDEDNPVYEVTIAAVSTIYGISVDIPNLNVERYMRNPVVLFSHDRWDNMPVARTVAIKLEQGGPEGIVMKARFQFLPDDEYAQRVHNAWRRGYLNAASISWFSEDGVDYLTEWSIVPIPADPYALRYAQKEFVRSLLGADPTNRREVSIMPETTNDTEVESTEVAEGTEEQARSEATEAAVVAPAVDTAALVSAVTESVGQMIATATEQMRTETAQLIGNEFARRDAEAQETEATTEAETTTEPARAAEPVVTPEAAPVVAEAAPAATRDVDAEIRQRTKIIGKARGLLPEGYDPFEHNNHDILVSALGVDETNETFSDDYLMGKLDAVVDARAGVSAEREQIQQAVATAETTREPNSNGSVVVDVDRTIPEEMRVREETREAYTGMIDYITSAWKRPVNVN